MKIPENTPLFRDIPSAEQEQLLSCLQATEKRYEKGAVILREGEPTRWMGLVLTGRVLLEHSDVSGNNAVLGSALPGAVFAEPYACLPQQPLLIRAVAAEESRVLFLQAERVLDTCPEVCAYHRQLLRNLLTVCAERNLRLSQRILHTSPKTIRGRLLSYFSDRVRQTGSNRFTVPYDRQQLADYLGVERSALCHELSKMRREGLLLYQKNQFEWL